MWNRGKDELDRDLSLTGINFISAKQCQCERAETRSSDASHSSNANVSFNMVNRKITETKPQISTKYNKTARLESPTQNQPRSTIDQYGYKNYSLKYPVTLWPPPGFTPPPIPICIWIVSGTRWCDWSDLSWWKNSEQPTCYANCSCLPQCMVLHGFLCTLIACSTATELRQGFTGVAP